MASKNKSSSSTTSTGQVTGGIIKALRRAGYNWKQATHEIIDNSVDAIVEKQLCDKGFEGEVFILAKPKSGGSRSGRTSEIHIIDNGCGMSPAEIIKSMDLGSSNKGGNDTGVFGLGMKTAAMHLGTEIQVTSRNKATGVFHFSGYDFNEVDRTGKWTLRSGPASTAMVRMIEDKIGHSSSGTCVSIYGVDTTSSVPSRSTSFYDSLMPSVKRIYREFLKTNGSDSIKLKISAGERNNAKYLISSTDEDIDYISVKGKSKFYLGSEDGFEDVTFQGLKFKVRLAHTKMGKGHGSKNKGPKLQLNGDFLGDGWKNQYRKGWYFIRNGREIALKTSPFWDDKKEGLSMVSNFLGEIIFEDDGSQSMPVKCDFGKKGVEITDEFKDFMKAKCRHALTSMRQQESQKRVATLPEEEKIEAQSKLALRNSVLIQCPTANNSDKEGVKLSSKKRRNRIQRPPKGSEGKPLDSVMEPLRNEDRYGHQSNWSWVKVNAVGNPAPFWSIGDGEGNYVVSINVANTWIAGLLANKNYKVIHSLSAGYCMAAQSCEFLDDQSETELLAEFGNIVQDFENEYEETEAAA